jgi:putative ABC transport system permease protein
MPIWWLKTRALFTIRRARPDQLRGEGIARDASTFTALETLAKDLLYAARMARKSPVYASTAILTLALGIGGVTAMFTVIRTVLLKPLDYPDPDRLVRVLTSGPHLQPGGPFNLILYQELRKAPGFFAFGALGIPESATISIAGSLPQPVKEARVSANFLDILGVKPLLGRSFTPDEDRTGGPNVVLISYGLWKRRFGENPKIVGSAVDIDAQLYTVAGVLPPHFEYPWSDYDLWVPRRWEWAEVALQGWERAVDMSGLARLKPNVTLDQVRAQLNVISRRYDGHTTMYVERLGEGAVRNLRSLLWMLFAAVGFVLLIVCANVAGLFLARSAARSREFAVRTALGAGRRRLVQQMLAESVSLTLAGAVLGIAFAHGILSAMTHIATLDLPRAAEIHIDNVVLAFTAVVSVATGLLCGCLPSLRFSRPDLADFLREQGAAAGRASTARPRFGISARGYLVVAQIALCVVLIAGASLMLVSFVRLRSLDPGIRPAHLLTMEIALPIARYNTDQKKQAFWDELLRRTDALPGVLDAAASRSIPTTIPNMMLVQVAEQPRKEVSERPVVDFQAGTPEYFRTFGIRLVRGRQFTAQDRDGTPRVGMINESFARLFWPSYPRGQNPLGQHLLTGARGNSLEIIGIVGDVHEDALASKVTPELYVPSAQFPLQTAYLAVKTAGSSTSIANTIRAQVAAIDSEQSVSHVQSMTQVLSESLGSRRLTLILLGSFALVAILITFVGIYGVIAFLVAERTREFGIRQALGAQRGDILRLVLGQGLRLVLAGSAFGIVGAAAVARIMKAALFGVNAHDFWTFAVVFALLLIVGLAASYLPARRAARMYPSAAMR